MSTMAPNEARPYTFGDLKKSRTGPFDYYVVPPGVEDYPDECYKDSEPNVWSATDLRQWLKKAEEAEEAGKPKRYWRDAAGFIELEDDLDGWRYLFPINDYETLSAFIDNCQDIIRGLELN